MNRAWSLRGPLREDPYVQLPGKPDLGPPRGFKAYNLDQVLDGDLDPVIQACVDTDSAAKLAAASELALSIHRTTPPPRHEQQQTGRPAGGICCSPRWPRPPSGWPTRACPHRASTRRNSRRSCTASSGGVHRRGRDFDARYWEAIARREAREPLQHITGRAFFRYLELQVGPGVFVPRPETESVVDWAIHAVRAMDVVEPPSSTCAPAPAPSRSPSPRRCRARACTRSSCPRTRSGDPQERRGLPGRPSTRATRSPPCRSWTARSTW